MAKAKVTVPAEPVELCFRKGGKVHINGYDVEILSVSRGEVVIALVPTGPLVVQTRTAIDPERKLA